MDKLSLEVEFPIDNDRLQKEAKEARAQIEGVGETAEKVQARVEKQINEVISGTEKQASVAKTRLEELREQLTMLEKELARNTNPETSTLGIPLENSYWDKYKEKIKSVRDEIALLENPVPIDQIDESEQKLKHLEEQIDKVGGSVKNSSAFMTMLARVIPGIGLASLFSSALKPLVEMVLNMDIFKKKLTDTQKEAKLLGDALGGSEYKKAIATVSELRINIDLAKQGLYDKKAAIKEYNESIGAVAGKVESLSDAEQGLIDNADNYVKMMLYKASATLALEEAAKKAVEASKIAMDGAEVHTNRLKNKNLNFGDKFWLAFAQDDGKTKEQIAKRTKEKVDAVNEELDSFEKIAADFQRKQADIVKSMGGVLGFDQKADDKAKKEMERSVAAAQAMQQKIYDLKAEYTRKAKSKDEEELQAVRDKFIKIKEETERFNKDKKNQVKVSVEGLDEVRDLALADLKYKQETEKLKISLSEQKELYRDYEDFKTSLGKEKADEKYRELIDTEKSHLENLRAELEKIPVEGASGSQDARKVELEKQIREEESLQLKKFNDLLKANQSYQDKIKIATEQFEVDRDKLLADGKVEEAKVLEKSHADNLLLLNENHIQQLDAYRKLFEGIELLSNAQAKNVIDEAKEMLANTDMPEALYLKIFALIRESEKALDDRIYDRVAEIGGAFDEIAAGVGEMNEGLSTSVGILGDMLHAASIVGKSIGSIKTGIADYGANKANAGGGALGTIAGVAAIAGPIGSAVGAVANLAKGIVGVFKAAKESRIQAEKELAEFDAQKLNAEFEINAIYRDRLRMQVETNKASLDGLKESHALLMSQQKEVERDADRVLKTLQGEEYVSGMRTEKHGGFLGIGKKTRTVDILSSLAGKDYEDIEKLFVSNQLTDRAKELFLQLEKLKKEGVDVDKMIADNTAAIWAKATGTTSESITDSIIKGFANGYRSASDFANDFKGLMNQATREIFRDFVQNKEMEAFYERYANMAKDGALTEAQRAELKLVYDGMIGRISNKYDELKGITGEDFLNDKANDKAMSGIQRELTTEKTASEFTGLTRANFDLNKKQHAVTEKMLEVEERHMNATFEMLRHTALIEHNTANTVTELRLAVIELKDINKNTSSNSSSYDRGN